MKRKFVSILLIICFLVLLLVGCQSGDEVMMDDVSDIETISLAEAKAYGKITNQSLKNFENPEDVDVFKKAFMHAKREKINLESVDYDLIITDGTGDYLLQFHLGEEGEKSAFFYIGYEDKVYVTSAEETRELRKVINP